MRWREEEQEEEDKREEEREEQETEEQSRRRSSRLCISHPRTCQLGPRKNCIVLPCNFWH